MTIRAALTLFMAVTGAIGAAAPANAQSLDRDSAAWYPIRLTEPGAKPDQPQFTVGAKLMFVSVKTDGSEIVQGRRAPRIRDRYDLTDHDMRGPSRWRQPSRGTLAASARLRF